MEIHFSRVEIPQKNVFSANSIFNGSRSTDELWNKRNSDSSSTRLRTPRNSISVKSRCIGRLATILVRGKWTQDSSSPCLNTPWEPNFREIPAYRLPSNHCHPTETDTGFDFPTSRNPLRPRFGEIPEYRLPSNHCGPRETDPGFEFLASNYPYYDRNLSQLVSFPAMFFWPGDRQTNRQTNKQTNFNFVRPSFQSREWCFLCEKH